MANLTALTSDPVQFKKYPNDRAAEDVRPAVRERPSSVFFISSKFESLDYNFVESRMVVQEEKTRSYRYLVWRGFLRTMCFATVGLLISVIGVYIDLSIHFIGRVKYSFLRGFVDEEYNKGAEHMVLLVLVWYLSTLVPAMVSTSLVNFIAPYAAGGGVAQTVAYLNGVRVPKVLSLKGLFVKMLSTTCTCVSGLAGGKEGPLLHIGATIGGRVPDLFARVWPCPACQDFRNDQERRDLAAAGFAAGIACAFKAPVGGLLLAIEEGISYWNLNLMWKIFICSISSVFFIMSFMSVAEGTPGYFNNPHLLTLGKISELTTRYEYFEILYFIVLGIIGGLMGSVLVFIHMRFTTFRIRYVNTKLRKLFEVFVVATLVATLTLLALLSYTGCRLRADKEQAGGYAANSTEGQIYCKPEEYSVMSLLIYQTQEGVIHIMLSLISDDADIGALVILMMLYFINVNLTMGLTLSAGVFVPQIVFGSIYGRLFGLFVKWLHNDAYWALPSKYAFLGAAAQLSGTIRKTFSVMVIMMEASSNISFGVPLMIVVTTVKIVGNIFTMPLYEMQAHMQGLPLLYSDPPPLSKEINVSEVMSTGQLMWLPPEPQVRDILLTLDNNKHNGFPVLVKSSGYQKLKGLILRHDLLVLLKYKMYKYPTPTTTKELMERRSVFRKVVNQELTINDVKVDDQYLSKTVDITPYLDPFPYTTSENSSLTATYKLFRSIGLRHLIVVNDMNEPVGVVTRKDLAKFHTWEHNCMMGVKELYVRVY